MRKIVGLIVLLSLIGINVNAARYLSEETIKVAFVDSVDQDIFGGARNVEIFGFVDGDIYAGCETIIIEGKVADDVLVGCRTMTVQGVIGDGLIFFGETVVIDGTVHGDIMAFGKEVRITNRAKLGGNLYIGCGQLRLDGSPVAGFIKGTVGNAYLNGPVGKEVELEVGHINFGQEYVAGGGTLLKLREELDQSKLDFIPQDLETVVKPREKFFQSVFFYWSLLALMVTGFILLALFRDFSSDLVSFSHKNIPVSIGSGFLTLIATPVIIVILAIFIVTIPAALILLALYLVILYLSFLASSLFIGDYLLRTVNKGNGGPSVFLSLPLGVIPVIFLPQIPFIGWLFTLAFISFGSGSLIMYIWQVRKAGTNNTIQ